MDLDTSIIIIFLVTTLIVGMGHGLKIYNIREYALGGRDFSTAALTATIVATWASGSGFFATLARTYSDGFLPVISSFGIGLSFVILSYILLPRMEEFLGKTSIAEAMGDMYGREVRIITAIAGSIGSAGLIAVQFRVFGNLFSYFMSAPSYIAIVISGVIATTYSAFGGIRAVTFTDVLQFLAFGLIIPFIGFFVWSDFFDRNISIVDALSQPQFNFSLILSSNNPQALGMFFMFLYFVIPSISPPAFQRIAIGKNIAQIQKAFFYAGIFLISIQILTAWIPFLIYTITPDIPKGQLIGYIVDNYSYPGLKGMIIVTIIALAMSTADSRINSVTVLFTNDICKILKKDLHNEMVWSRAFAIFLGFGAILLALIETDFLDIILLAHSFYYPLITPIFLLSIFGFRTTSKSVLIALFASTVVTIVWKFIPIISLNISQKVLGIFVAMFFNLLFLFGSHYLLKQPGGWKKTLKTNKNNLTLLQKIKAAKTSLLSGISSPKSPAAYTTMGIYFFILSITTMYSTHSALKGDSSQLVSIIYQIMLVTSTTMAMFPLWPRSISENTKKLIISIWWPISAFLMLIFFSCFFVIVSKFSTIQISLFVTNCIVSSTLFGWRASMILIPLGGYSSAIFYHFVANKKALYIGFGSPELLLIYIMIVVAIALIVFLKPKQEEQEATLAEVKYLKKEIDYAQREFDNLASGLDFLREQFNKKEGGLREKEKILRNKLQEKEQEISKLVEIKEDFLRNIPHETNTPLTGIISFCEILYDSYDSLDSKEIKQCVKQIIKSSDRLQTYVDSIIDLSKLSSSGYKIEKSKINLKDMISCKVVSYKKHFDDERDKQKFILDLDNLVSKCDNYYIARTIEHLIVNAVNYGKGKEIKISLKPTTDNKVKFDITDYGIGISEHELDSIFDKFTVGEKTRSKAGGRGVGLALCKAIINAHEGEIYATSSKKNGTTFTFVI